MKGREDAVVNERNCPNHSRRSTSSLIDHKKSDRSSAVEVGGPRPSRGKLSCQDSVASSVLHISKSAVSSCHQELSSPTTPTMDDTRCDPVPPTVETDEDPLSRLLVDDIISNAAQELLLTAAAPPLLPVFRDLAGEKLEVDPALFDNSKSLFYLKNTVLLPALRNRGVMLASGFWIELLVATEEEEVGGFVCQRCPKTRMYCQRNVPTTNSRPMYRFLPPPPNCWSRCTRSKPRKISTSFVSSCACRRRPSSSRFEPYGIIRTWLATCDCLGRR